MQRKANTYRFARDPYGISHIMDKLSEWSIRPMTPGTECVVSAIVGALFFAILTACYLSVG